MEKKTKLTISGSAKKSIKNIEIAKTQGKNSVVIEKQIGKFPSRGGSFRHSDREKSKSKSPQKTTILQLPITTKFPSSAISSF